MQLYVSKLLFNYQNKKIKSSIIKGTFMGSVRQANK